MQKKPDLYPIFLSLLGIIVIGRFLYKDYADYFDLAFITVLTFYLYQRKKINMQQQ